LTEPNDDTRLAPPEPRPAPPDWGNPVWAQVVDREEDWQAPPPARDRLWLHGLLFGLTLLTTAYVGAGHWLSFLGDFGTVIPRVSFASVAVNGLWYAVTIMVILTAHEAGHYLACRYHRVDASLPYFLPFPYALSGTVGAFIRIRSPLSTKRILFDVGVAGPIAGFAVLLPALVIGIRMSELVPLPSQITVYELGEPLLYQAAVWLIWGDIPAGLSLNMHPMAFAAWFGLLLTFMNLMPIGQFDGGHVAYAVFGPAASRITIATVIVAIGLSIYSPSLILWTAIAIFLLWKFGWHHPPTWDSHVPLDAGRKWVALLAFVILCVCFMPKPISLLDLVAAP